MIKFLYGILLLLALPVCAQAQTKLVTKNSLYWLNAAANLQVAPTWTVSIDFEERRFMRPSAQHQLLATVSGTYSPRDKPWKLGAAFCAFYQSPNDPESEDRLMRPEWRPLQYFRMTTGKGRVKLKQRVQMEQRWLHKFEGNELRPGYNFIMRFRYRLTVEFLLWQQQSKERLKLDIGSESHLQAGGATGGQVFDQFRNSATVLFSPMKKLWLSLGYLHWYQQTGPNAYANRHILVAGISYDIRLYKEQGSK